MHRLTYVLQIFLDSFICQANTNGTGYFFFDVRRSSPSHLFDSSLLFNFPFLTSFSMNHGRSVNVYTFTWFINWWVLNLTGCPIWRCRGINLPFCWLQSLTCVTSCDRGGGDCLQRSTHTIHNFRARYRIWLSFFLAAGPSRTSKYLIANLRKPGCYAIYKLGQLCCTITYGLSCWTFGILLTHRLLIATPYPTYLIVTLSWKLFGHIASSKSKRQAPAP